MKNNLNRFTAVILEVENVPIQLPLPIARRPPTSTNCLTKLQLAKQQYEKKYAYLNNYKARGW